MYHLNTERSSARFPARVQASPFEAHTWQVSIRRRIQTLLTAEARDVFPAALEVDDATWARGRGTALSVAIVTLPYYLNTNPAIVASARNTIDEVLADHGLGACHNSASGIEIQFDSLEGAEGPPRALARSTAAGSAPVQPSNPRGLTNSASSRLD